MKLYVFRLRKFSSIYVHHLYVLQCEVFVFGFPFIFSNVSNSFTFNLAIEKLNLQLVSTDCWLSRKYTGPSPSGKRGSYEIRAVCWLISNHFFSKIAHRIFHKLHMKYECLKSKKLTGLDFLEKKVLFFGKSPKIPQNRAFWFLPKIQSIDLFFQLLMIHCDLFLKTNLLWSFVQKLHAWERSVSQFISQNILGRSNCRIF